MHTSACIRPLKGPPGDLAGDWETLPLARGRRRGHLLGDRGAASAHAQSPGQADATSGEQRVPERKEADRDPAWPISCRGKKAGGPAHWALRVTFRGEAGASRPPYVPAGWPGLSCLDAGPAAILSWVGPRVRPPGRLAFPGTTRCAGWKVVLPPREASAWCLERTRTLPSRRDGCRRGRRLPRRPLRTAVCCLRPRPLPSVALPLPRGPVWDADSATRRGRGRVGLPASCPIPPPGRAPR